MEQDIFCGEIKHNLVDSLISQLSEIYIPLLRAQEDWGSCTQDDVRHFLLGLDRYVSALQDSAGAAVRSEKQQVTLKLLAGNDKCNAHAAFLMLSKNKIKLLIIK